MNAYRLAMEQCTVPDGLQERLRNAVLKNHPQKAKPFRPRGFVRKTRLALLAAVLLLLLGAAAVWNSSFVRRFGPMAALSYMGGATFQDVNVTSVCDDVSLTVTQALCSEKSIFVHIVYMLPEELRGQDYDVAGLYDLQYYGTGDITWEMLKEHDGEAWKQVNWGEFTSYIGVIHDPVEQKSLLAPYDMTWSRQPVNGQMLSGYGNSAGVDREAGTVAWMQHVVLDTGWDFTSQPLTILVPPPLVVLQDGTSFPATDHPAIVTFQPAYDGPQSLTGTYQDDAVELRATLTPFSLSLYADGCGYEGEGELCRDTWLVTETGREIPVYLVGWTNSGGGDGYVATTVHTFAILETGEYTAVRIGNYIVPLGAPETGRTP